MPVPTPHSASDAWGGELTEDVSKWVRQIAREAAVPRDERPDREGGSTLGVYREASSSSPNEAATERRSLRRCVDLLSERIERLEDEQRETRRVIRRRLGAANERIDALNGRLDQMRKHLNQRLDNIVNRASERLNRLSN